MICHLSATAKAEIKEWLLAQDKVSYLDLDAIAAEAAKPDFTALAAALRSGAPKEQVYAAMKPFADFLRPAAHALLKDKVREIGSPEMNNVQTIIIIAALDRYPGIRTDLAAFFARPEVEADEDLRYDLTKTASASNVFATYGMPADDEANVALVEKIAVGAPSPAYAQALARAVRAEGIDISLDEALAVFSKETVLGGVLATILGEFHGEITPATLETIARGAVRSHGAGDIPQMVEKLRGDLLDKVDTNNFYSIPERYIDAAQDAVAALRLKFGAEAVPEGALFTNVANLSSFAIRLRPLVEAVRKGRRIVTPAEFRQAAFETGLHVLMEKTVHGEFAAAAAQLGGPAPKVMVAQSFLKRNPLLVRALREADDPDDIRAALDGVREPLRTIVAQETELEQIVVTAKDVFAENLAFTLHLTKEETGNFGGSNELNDRLQELKNAIQDGTHPGCREEDFSAPMAFNLLIHEFVELYRQRFAAINALQGVSDETKAALREILKKEGRPDKPFVDPACAQRIAARVDGTALLAALGDPNATDEARIAAIRAYADAIDAAATEEFRDLIAQRGEGLGMNDYIPIVANVRAFVVGATPGLKAALERLSADPFALRAPMAFQQGEHLDHPLRSIVANTLFGG